MMNNDDRSLSAVIEYNSNHGNHGTCSPRDATVWRLLLVVSGRSSWPANCGKSMHHLLEAGQGRGSVCSSVCSSVGPALLPKLQQGGVRLRYSPKGDDRLPLIGNPEGGKQRRLQSWHSFGHPLLLPSMGYTV